MNWLLENWRKLPDIGRLLNDLEEIKTVRGVLLGLDPFWLEVWNAYHVIRKNRDIFDALRALDLPISDRDFESWAPVWPKEHRANILEKPVQFENLFSLFECVWKSPWGKASYGPPLQITVVTEKFTDIEFLAERARRLEGPLRYSIVQSVRGRSWLCMPKNLHSPVPGGVSVGTGAKLNGTLGGYLYDDAQNPYAVTCAHVVQKYGASMDHPAQVDNSAHAAVLGTVNGLAPLKPSSSSSICNPFHPHAHLHTVDAALIKLTGKATGQPHILGLRAPSGIAQKSAVNIGDLLDMAGKESGCRQLLATKLAITFKYDDQATGDSYCFKEAFEVVWPTNGASQGPPAVSGDSGAWLLNSASEWVGMLVAADTHAGYAIYAENVEDWARNELRQTTPLTVG